MTTTPPPPPPGSGQDPNSAGQTWESPSGPPPSPAGDQPPAAPAYGDPVSPAPAYGAQPTAPPAYGAPAAPGQPGQPSQYAQPQQYGGYQAPPPGFGGKPRKPRPRGVWFLIPLALLVVAIGMFVWSASNVKGAVLDAEATFQATGEPEAVTLQSAGPRLLWIETSAYEAGAECTVTENGAPVTLDTSTGNLVKDTGIAMKAVAGLTPTGTQLEVTCSGPTPYQVEIGKSPVSGILSAVAGGLGGFVLGGIGTIWLIVLAVLFFTRPKRQQV